MIHHTLIRLWAATNSRIPDNRERGANLVEYVLLIGLIALVCIAAVTLLGESTAPSYSELSSGISS